MKFYLIIEIIINLKENKYMINSTFINYFLIKVNIYF